MSNSRPVPFVWRLMDATPRPLRALVLFAWFAALLPCLPVLIFLQRLRRKRLIATLRAHRRLITWAELRERAGTGKGTVLIEVGCKPAVRFWWTDESVKATSPIPPVAFSDLDLIAGGGYVAPPFIKWCYDRYVNPHKGIALFAFPIELPDNPVPFRAFESFWRDYFPSAEVVFITVYDYRDA